MYQACEVARRRKNWLKYSQDLSIISIVSGLCIPVSRPLYQNTAPRELVMTPPEKVIIDSEIASMLHQKVIESVPSSPDPGEYISNILLNFLQPWMQ